MLPFITKGQVLKPTENEALINVIVNDFSNKPRKGEIIIIQNVKTKKETKYTADANGKFALLLTKGESYKFYPALFKDEETTKVVDIPNQKGEISANITINIEFENKEFTLDKVYFDTAKVTLKAESNKTLNDLFDILKAKPTMIIELQGHTDNVGNTTANQKLSEDRANAVKDYLEKKGIASSRITTKGFGDTQPIEDNSTEEGRKKNRRTVVKIVKE